MKREPSIFDEADPQADSRGDAEAMADIAAGRVVADREVAAWLDTWGTPEEAPAPERWFK